MSLWVVVVPALAYGLYNTIIKVVDLFTGEDAGTRCRRRAAGGAAAAVCEIAQGDMRVQPCGPTARVRKDAGAPTPEDP
jgi:hypothetical protein